MTKASGYTALSGKASGLPRRPHRLRLVHKQLTRQPAHGCDPVESVLFMAGLVLLTFVSTRRGSPNSDPAPS